MKAIKLNGTGGVEVLQYTDEPDPTPGPNEVLVEVAAAGVNFMDIGERRGMIGGGYKPTILGVEGAGRILEQRVKGQLGQLGIDPPPGEAAPGGKLDVGRHRVDCPPERTELLEETFLPRFDPLTVAVGHTCPHAKQSAPGGIQIPAISTSR